MTRAIWRLWLFVFFFQSSPAQIHRKFQPKPVTLQFSDCSEIASRSDVCMNSNELVVLHLRWLRNRN
uniref:Putative secreted protein n=1 Tax=Anopheles darlingi TaxID=43151 RepID=A0A2M4DCF8_ANODA